MNKYSTEEKQQAIDLYFKNGCNMKKTVRELGYGSATGILRWLRETVPDKVSKPVQRKWKVDYPEEIKQAAVIDLCESNSSTADIAEKYGISRANIREESTIHWERKLYLKQQKLNSKEYYINEINQIKRRKRLVEQEQKYRRSFIEHI